MIKNKDNRYLKERERKEGPLADSVGRAYYFFLNSLKMFIYFERERERDRQSANGGGAERKTQNLKQAPGSQLSTQSVTWGSDPQTTRS